MTAPRWTLSHVAALIGAEFAAAMPNLELSRMATDSRTTQTEPALFWALTTPSGDGHRHLAEAKERGCVAAVGTSKGSAQYAVEGMHVLVVDDVWEALFRFAAAHRAAAAPVLAPK